jgi:hypothetical protein
LVAPTARLEALFIGDEMMRVEQLKASMLNQIRAYVNFEELSKEQAEELHYLPYLGLILVDTTSPDGALEERDWQTIVKNNLPRVLKPSKWKAMSCPGVEITQLAGIRRITVSFWALKKPSGKDPSVDEHREPFSVRNITFAQITPA